MIKVISTGRNSAAYAQRCLDSIEAQTYPHFEVMVVDDASDDASAEIIGAFCDEHPRFSCLLRDERVGAMCNQWEGLHRLGVDDDDIVVWVDTDDRLAHPGVFERIVRAYEDQGALVAYGSYRPDPPDHPSAKTCAPARRYPDDVIADRRFRTFCNEPGGGIFINHVRTIAGSIFNQLDESDCRHTATGEWYQCAPDTAIMFPALELAAPHIVVMDETLLLYTCDNAAAEWRLYASEVNRAHEDQISRAPKR